MPRKRWKWPILATLILIVAVAAPPAWKLWHAYRSDGTGVPLPKQGVADDVSRLNATPIDSLVRVSEDPEEAVAQLVSLVTLAAQRHLPISIAGARHSMGGHTIARNGVQVDMLTYKQLSLDTATHILTVGSGALWSEVIPYLDRYGRAVAVMQSDNAFSVGGSISVNCHGWQHNKAPIASTVESFRLLKADGTIVRCSRTENAELFSLVLGGYGLFGIILDVDLRTVPNERYTYHRVVVGSDNYVDTYARLVDTDTNVRMVYGRLNVNADDFLQRAMLNYFTFDSAAPIPGGFEADGLADLKRSIFLASKDDDYGKRLRWNSEQAVTKTRIGTRITRNQVMNESPSIYMNRTADHTDILHEYFIPRRNFSRFIAAMQQYMPEHKQDLLNVTVRNVYRDTDSFLSYAHEENFAFVLFFDQLITPEAEADMLALTRKLIDAALALDGAYYLPYRLHASPEQLRKAYPIADTFFAKKRQYDPHELFQNTFYRTYGAPAPLHP
ncbi:MAG: FAD-binding oxidoreductase [Flavobacteriales bacterium]|nr:FAD-binding oxidoreductase [Flavobacteriales bacterium]